MKKYFSLFFSQQDCRSFAIAVGALDQEYVVYFGTYTGVELSRPPLTTEIVNASFFAVEMVVAFGIRHII